MKRPEQTSFSVHYANVDLSILKGISNYLRIENWQSSENFRFQHKIEGTDPNNFKSTVAPTQKLLMNLVVDWHKQMRRNICSLHCRRSLPLST